jgi:short-subunit dehydrogenase
VSNNQRDYLRRYGPYAIVVGASRGIGAELADQLAAKGFGVVLIARTESQLVVNAQKLRETYGVEAIPLPIDLAQQTAAADIMKATDGLDVGLLVYNAALGFSGGFWERDLDYYQSILATNLLTPFELVYRFAPRLMRQRRGGIIMISSAAGQTAQPYLIGYSGTKAWNTNFSMGLAAELQPYGVDVLNAIVGSTDTPGLRDMMSESFLDGIRLAKAEDVATEVLANLGKRPTRIIGAGNRLTMAFFRIIGLNASLKLMKWFMARLVYKGQLPVQPIDAPEFRG